MKYIIFFALLSGLCSLLVFSRRISSVVPCILGLGAIFAVLNHEMLLVYLPYLLSALAIREDGWGIFAKRTASLMVPAAVATLLVIAFGKADTRAVTAICNSIRSYAPRDCVNPEVYLGAITFLSKDVLFAHQFVHASITNNTLFTYALLTILSFTPLFLVLRSKRCTIALSKRARFLAGFLISLSFVATIPLFWIVADYGRIIHIHVSSLSLLALMITHQRNVDSMYLSVRVGVEWILCLVFVASWRLTVWRASFDTAFPLLQHIIHALASTRAR
jgi:hypothetical protein